MIKIKVIDLLVKIAKEEIPEKIKYDDNIYEYNYVYDTYLHLENKLLSTPLKIEIRYLNDEVEIIEEDKKIEKLDMRNEKNCKNNWKWKVYGEEYSYNISTPQKIIADKINEIIDYINKENKK